MARTATLIILFLAFINCRGNAQVSVKMQAGVSYIEHLSAGITLGFAENHELSLLYGSNFFIRQKDFMNIMLQYNCSFRRMSFAGITPALGIRGGYSVFTNKYYKWKLSGIIPFARLSYNVNERIGMFFDSGIAVAIEHSVERISYGEIGMYREYLPEFKLGFCYRL